jgi:hypothetical protein
MLEIELELTDFAVKGSIVREWFIIFRRDHGGPRGFYSAWTTINIYNGG